MTKYVKQKDLAAYRIANKPKSCPLLGQSEYSAVVDHDHKSGKIRGVVSSEGNALLGKIENFFYSRCVHGKWDLPTVLRALAAYLEGDQGPFHPVGIRQVVKRYRNKSKDEQIKILKACGVDEANISECGNSTARAKLYRRILTGGEE